MTSEDWSALLTLSNHNIKGTAITLYKTGWGKVDTELHPRYANSTT